MNRLMLGVLISSICSFSVAEEIAYEKACPNGGSRVVNGEYDSVSGDFKLVTEIKDCGRHHEVVNGTHTAEGNFSLGNSIFSPTATVNAAIVSDLTVTNEEGSLTFQCSKTIEGQYDMTTLVLDGSIKSNCEQQGQLMIPILDLLSGDEGSDEGGDEMDEEAEMGEHEEGSGKPWDDSEISQIIEHCSNNGGFDPDSFSPDNFNPDNFNPENNKPDNHYPNNPPNGEHSNNGPWDGKPWEEEDDEWEQEDEEGKNEDDGQVNLITNTVIQ